MTLGLRKDGSAASPALLRYIAARVMVLSIAVLSPVWATTARAQQPIYTTDQATVSTDALHRLEKQLALSKDQIQVVQAIHDSYQQSFDLAHSAYSASMEDINSALHSVKTPSEQQQIFRQRADLMLSWGEQNKTIEKTFFDDVRKVLAGDEEIRGLNEFQMDLRRTLTLQRGARLSSERCDLFVIADKAGLSEADRARIAPILANYRIELDPHLVARNDILEQVFRQVSGQMTKNQTDKENFADLIGSFRARLDNERKAMVQVTGRNENAILSALATDPDVRWQFLTIFNQTGYPAFFNHLTDQANRLWTKFASSTQLTPQEHDAAHQIYLRYQSDCEPLDNSITDMADRLISAMTPKLDKPGTSSGGGDPQINDLRTKLMQAVTRRREIDQKAAQDMLNSLTNDHRAIFTGGGSEGATMPQGGTGGTSHDGGKQVREGGG